MASATTEPRQAIVDQLGANIWNHVQFAGTLLVYNNRDAMSEYLRMIDHFKTQGTEL